MNRSELIKQVAEQTGLTKTQAGEAVETSLRLISEALASGDAVRLKDFGAFNVKTYAPRKYHNPKTKTIEDLGERRLTSFKAYFEV